MFECCRLLFITLAKLFLDSKACYNWILVSLSNLACRNQGLHGLVANLYTQTLELMQYYPKHNLGLSKKSNGHVHPDPFHSISQGSGDSSTWWGFVSDKIIQVYNKTCHKAQIMSPISTKSFLEGAQLFGDDASLLIHQPQNSSTSLVSKIRLNAQKWEKLLNATRGKLKNRKCTLSVMEWVHDSNNIPKIWPTSSIVSIPVQNSSTKVINIVPSIPASKVYKLLGIQIAHDSNQKDQYKLMQQNATNMQL